MKRSALGMKTWMIGLGAAMAVTASPLKAEAQERYAAIVIDARTNEVLHEEAADEARFPASLTKMMTLYMLFEAMERGNITTDTVLTASRHAAAQPPSRLGLRRGGTITVDDAIRALCVQSANDVAVVLAERLGGTEARFAARMTARARELGMTNTNFANASGLPNPNQRSTARDMAILSQALWRDFPEHYHYFQTPDFAWRNHYGRNHNRLLGQVEGVDGIKTGYTRASGFNLASAAEREGRRVIAVVMGGATAAARDAQVAYLIEGAFDEYERRRTLDSSGTNFVNLPVNRVQGSILPNGAVVSTVSQQFGPNGAPLSAPVPSAESEGDAAAIEEIGDLGAQ